MTNLDIMRQNIPSMLEPFIFLYITEKCQLRCKHCYMGDRLERELFMSTDYVEELLSTLRVLYGHHKVYILGGEPTLHPEFRKILEICKKLDFLVVVTSNGLISSKAWQAIDKSLIDSLSFSMDGATADTHEFMRGKSNYNKLIECVKESVNREFNTRIIFTVTRRNYHEIEDVINFVEALGVTMISFHYFTPTGLGNLDPDLQLTPNEWLDLTRNLKAIGNRPRSVRIFYPPAFVNETELERLASLGYRGCTARNLERIAAFPDGRLYACSAFFDSDFHFATYHEGKITLSRESTNELDLMNVLTPKCKSCANNINCRGGCPAYDFYDRTYTSSDCTTKVVPICPLWSTELATSNRYDVVSQLR